MLKVLASVDAKGDGQMIDSISPWNEPDLSSATTARPFEAGQLFSVIRRICRERGCTALAGDFADSRFTTAYLSKYLDGAGAPMPLHWAWHAYDDAWTRRVDQSMPRLRSFLSLLPANARVRLSEQGGILWRPRSRLSGERRISQTPAQAGADLSFLLSKAATIDPRVNAFDVYQWLFRSSSTPKDGSVTITMANKRPKETPKANWLPIPKGQFNMMLRAYGPEGKVATGDYTPPAVKRR